MLARTWDVAMLVHLTRGCREVGWAHEQSHGCEDCAMHQGRAQLLYLESHRGVKNVLLFVLFSVHTSAALSTEQGALWCPWRQTQSLGRAVIHLFGLFHRLSLHGTMTTANNLNYQHSPTLKTTLNDQMCKNHWKRQNSTLSVMALEQHTWPNNLQSLPSCCFTTNHTESYKKVKLRGKNRTVGTPIP